MQAILTREPLRLNGDGDGGVNVVSPGKKLGNVIYRGACRDPNPAARGDAVNRVNHPLGVVSRILYFEKKESFVWSRLLLFDSGNGRSKIEFIEFVYIYKDETLVYLDSLLRLSLFSRYSELRIVGTKATMLCLNASRFLVALPLFKRLVKCC